MVKLVYTTDLKSVEPKGSCGFDPRSGYHHIKQYHMNASVAQQDRATAF